MPGAGGVINDGKASAYPVTTNTYVDGLAGTVTDVNLHINGFTHERPDDVDIMLVSPTGKKSLVMSDVAAGAPRCPASTWCSTRRRPRTCRSSARSSPARAPAGRRPTTVPPTPSPPLLRRHGCNDGLSAFDGLDPTGVWSLFVYDDRFDYFGTITGWSLELTTRARPLPVDHHRRRSGRVGGRRRRDPHRAGPTSSGRGGHAARRPPGPAGDDLQRRHRERPEGAGLPRRLSRGALPVAQGSGRDLPAHQRGVRAGRLPRPGADRDGLVDASARREPTGRRRRLFAVDDTEGARGSLAGWSLRITTADPVPTPTPTPTAGGTGGDTAAPRVASTRPATGAKAVRRGADITATFTEAVRPATVTRSSAYLVRKGSTNHLAATVTYRAATRQVVIDPAKRLRAGTTYRRSSPPRSRTWPATGSTRTRPRPASRPRPGASPPAEPESSRIFPLCQPADRRPAGAD